MCPLSIVKLRCLGHVASVVPVATKLAVIPVSVDCVQALRDEVIAKVRLHRPTNLATVQSMLDVDHSYDV